jgi:hypothetical protein
VKGTKVSFIDNFTLAFTHPDLQVIEATLKEDLRRVAKWAKRKRLTISGSKSQATLFTPDNKEMYVKPQLLFEGCSIPVEKCIKILGLTMDSLHTMTPQEKIAASKGRDGHSILKAVQGSDFGLSKEDGLIAFKALVVPRQGYGGPLWMPLRASLRHSVPNLQLVQNASHGLSRSSFPTAS